MITKFVYRLILFILSLTVIAGLFVSCETGIVTPNYRLDYIRDYQYAYGRIFDLGRVYGAANYDALDFVHGDSIIYLEVYTTAPYDPYGENDYPEAGFWVDPDDTALSPGESQRARVRKVDTSDYFYNPTEFWIYFERPNAGTQYEIGTYMIVKRQNGDIDTVGNIQEEPYQLKLLRLRSPASSMVTWNYEWKNVYSLMRRNIPSEFLENSSITVFLGRNDTEGNESNRSDQDGVPLNLILGLYKTDTLFADSGWKLDPKNFWLEQGLLIFPARRPFDTYKMFWDYEILSVHVPEIYDSNNNMDRVTASEYYIEIKTYK